ncbi:nucleotide exchange factor GrpE [Candidatus Peregrinibacteria bacterium]|nr:nucleotide exchange factor GrpE [Candidatus Peregrinibacteria bacterium]
MTTNENTHNAKKTTHKDSSGNQSSSDEIKRIQELEDELKKVYGMLDEQKKELESGKNQLLRALADVQNMRRRSEEEKGKLLFESARNILQAILPSLENFDRALQNLPCELNGNEWVQGILAIEKHLYDLLQKEGVLQIREVGIAFDPALHEAVILDKDGAKGQVTKILQKGFLYNGKVLWPAKVAVGEK